MERPVSRVEKAGSGGERAKGASIDGSAQAGGKAVLENYIVRIYRRDLSDPERIVGVAREIGSDRNCRFGCFEELKRILCAGESLSPRKKKTGFRNKGRRAGLA